MAERKNFRIRSAVERCLHFQTDRWHFVNCAYGDEPALERQKNGEAVRWSLDARQKLTIRISVDDGKNWDDGFLLAEEGGRLTWREQVRCTASMRKDGRTVTVFLTGGYCWHLFHWRFYDETREGRLE